MALSQSHSGAGAAGARNPCFTNASRDGFRAPTFGRPRNDEESSTFHQVVKMLFVLVLIPYDSWLPIAALVPILHRTIDGSPESASLCRFRPDSPGDAGIAAVRIDERCGADAAASAG